MSEPQEMETGTVVIDLASDDANDTETNNNSNVELSINSTDANVEVGDSLTTPTKSAEDDAGTGSASKEKRTRKPKAASAVPAAVYVVEDTETIRRIELNIEKIKRLVQELSVFESQPEFADCAIDLEPQIQYFLSLPSKPYLSNKNVASSAFASADCPDGEAMADGTVVSTPPLDDNNSDPETTFLQQLLSTFRNILAMIASQF